MGWLLLNVAMIAGLGVAFYTLGGGAGNQGLRTLPLWAGAWLICLSYWFLPWVRLDPETIIENVVPSGALINDILDFTGLDTMVANVTSWTGWGFINTVEAVPLVSSDFLFRLHVPFYLALASLATVATVAVRPHAPLVRVLGAILALGSAVCAVLLLLSLGRIRTFGVQPTLTDIVVQFAGIRLGVGIWVIVAGLISLALGGAVLTLQAGRPGLRRGTGGSRRGQTARSPRRTGIANKGRRS